MLRSMMVRFLVTVLICAASSPVCAQASGTSTTNKANLVALERIWGQAQVNRDARTVAAMLGEHFVDTEYDGITNNAQRISRGNHGSRLQADSHDD